MHDDQTLSLKNVLSIIPNSCYENPTWKGLVYLTLDTVLYGFIVYGLLASDNPLLLIPLWVLAGLSVSALFICGHDAAHGALFKNKRLSGIFGRLAMLPAFHAYSAWCLGHNRVHHSFTVKEEKDFVWHPLSHEEYRKLSWMGKLKHRIEWSMFGAGLYYLWEIWWKKMFFFKAPKKLAKEIREDKRTVTYFCLFTFVLAILVGEACDVSVWYSYWTWIKVLVIPWLTFNYIIGATVHIHHIQPDIPWHSHGVWNKFKGQVEGTTNFRIPKFLNVFFHNIFLHIPHHVDPRIPFYNLPAAAEEIRRYYQLTIREQKFRLRNYFRATRLCKLYDFEREIWLNYRGEPIVNQTSAIPTPA